MMRYIANIDIPGYEYDHEYLDSEIDLTSDDFIEELVWDFCNKTGFLDDAFYSYTTQAIGCPTINMAYQTVCSAAKEFVCRFEDNLKVSLFEYVDNHSPQYVKSWNIKSWLMERIEYESDNGEFDAKLAGFIEASLSQYAIESKWSVVFLQEKEKPLLWFGPSSKITNTSWLIDLNEDVDLSFWFEVNYYEFLLHIGIDDDSCFMIWYGECCCDIPDMDEVRKKCPITLEEDDDADSLMHKLIVAELAEKKDRDIL